MRSIYKITSPTDQAVACLGDPVNESTSCWLFDGIGYTHNEGIEAYAARTDGYTVERVTLVDAEFGAYQAKCAAARNQDEIALDTARDAAAGSQR